jgi:hypothetical protein
MISRIICRGISSKARQLSAFIVLYTISSKKLRMKSDGGRILVGDKQQLYF